MKVKNNLNRKGFSLLEMLVSLGIIAVMLVMLSNVLVLTLRVSNRTFARSNVREELSTVLSSIKKDLRNADYVTTCEGSLGSTPAPQCEMILSETVTWKVCPDSDTTGTNANTITSLCKYEGEDPIAVQRTPDYIDIQKFSFDSGFEESEDRKVILMTVIAKHANANLKINDIVLQTSITTRNFGTPKSGQLAVLPVIPSPTPIGSTSGTIIHAENFDSITSSYFNSQTPGSGSTWTVQQDGFQGNALQAKYVFTNSSTSEARAYRFTVPQNTNLTVSIYMRTGGSAFYRSTVQYRLSSGSFSPSPSSNLQNTTTTVDWPNIVIFCNQALGCVNHDPDGNNYTWTQYSTTINTGSNTFLYVGMRYHFAGPALPHTTQWDRLEIKVN